MLFGYLSLLLLAILSYARDIRNAQTTSTPPNFILPVQHVREVQSGYLTFKDHQLGSESAESADVKPTNCIPRDSPEGIERLHIINKQLAEASGKEEVQTTAQGRTEESPQITSENATDVQTEPTTQEAENVSEEPSRPPFNDTTPFDGVDVGETVELRIYKPLCDY